MSNNVITSRVKKFCDIHRNNKLVKTGFQVGVMMRRIADSGDEKLVQALVNKLVGRFAHSPKWALRQM